MGCDFRRVIHGPTQYTRGESFPFSMIAALYHKPDPEAIWRRVLWGEQDTSRTSHAAVRRHPRHSKSFRSFTMRTTGAGTMRSHCGSPLRMHARTSRAWIP